jgi:GNAT superfamily N-acetyltransferase
MGLRIAAEPIASADAQALIAQLDAYLNGLYPPENNFLELPHDDVDGTQGVFLVARVDGEAVGCGATRFRGNVTVEVKRMYVRPDARGSGVGRAILRALEDWARERGASALVLETGDDQPEAHGLYRDFGFVVVPCFDEYAASTQSVCYEKRLT